MENVKMTISGKKIKSTGSFNLNAKTPIIDELGWPKRKEILFLGTFKSDCNILKKGDLINIYNDNEKLINGKVTSVDNLSDGSQTISFECIR